MKAYVLNYSLSKGNCYFKSFNPYVKEVEWTGVLNRCAFWLDKECAENQAASIELKLNEVWNVQEVDL